MVQENEIYVYRRPVNKKEKSYQKENKNPAGVVVTMYTAFHPRNDKDRLYVTRKEGGRRFDNIKDSLDAWIRWLKNNITNSKERQIIAASNAADSKRTKRTKITEKQKMEKKHLYGYFKRQIGKIS